MKILSVLLFAVSIIGAFIGALFMLNNIEYGKIILLTGTLATWLGIVLVVYYWIIVPRRKR